MPVGTVVPTDTCDEGGGLGAFLADADGVRIRGYTCISNINITTAVVRLTPADSPKAMLLLPAIVKVTHCYDGRVASPGAVAKECMKTIGCVTAAGRVAS
jgi:hypothetical protein